jgi:hypothetical protein
MSTGELACNRIKLKKSGFNKERWEKRRGNRKKKELKEQLKDEKKK